MPGADRPRRTGNLTRDEKLGKLGPEGIRKQKAENAAFRAARKELNHQLATGLTGRSLKCPWLDALSDFEVKLLCAFAGIRVDKGFRGNNVLSLEEEPNLELYRKHVGTPRWAAYIKAGRLPSFTVFAERKL